MDERKRLGGLPSFWIKIILAVTTCIIIFSQPTHFIPALSYNQTLFQSGFYSLLILGFWLFAYHFLRSDKLIKLEKNNHYGRYRHIKYSILFSLTKTHTK